MKTITSLVCLSLTLSLAWAQEPFVYETATELSSTANLNNDTRADLVIVDRSTGAVRFGTTNADGSVTWVTQLTGVVGASSMCLGAPATGQADVCLLTSPWWNRIERVTPSSVLSPLLITGLDLSGMAPGLTTTAEVSAATPLISTSILNQRALLVNEIAFDRELSSILTNQSLRAGNSIRYTSSRRCSVFIDEGAREAQLWNSTATASGAITKLASLSGLPVQARLAEIPLGTNFHLCHWAPGATSFSHSRINYTRTIIDNFSFSPALTVTTPMALGSIHFLAATGTGNADSLLLLLSADGTNARTFILSANGTTLTERQSFTPPSGQSFTGAQMSGNGSFYLFRGVQGRTSNVQLLSYNGSTHSAGATSLLPTLSGSRTTANVYTFTAEPFVNASATFVKSFKVRDWTISATNTNGTLTVSGLQDAGPATGLGSPANQNVSGATSGHFAVPNQLRPDTSLASLGNDFGVARPGLSFDPPPGLYSALPLVNGLPITINSSQPMSAIYFRLNGGPWQKYAPTDRDVSDVASTPPSPTEPLAARPIIYSSGSIEALGIPQGQEISTPTSRASYQLGATGALATTPPLDSNQNGLSDAWEKTFGLNDPNGDADGDGFSNLVEANAGTDPRDPNSRSTGPIPLPELTILNVLWEDGPRAIVSWQSIDTTLILETSTTLRPDWTPVPAAILIDGNTRSYPHPITPGTRFFRLRRP